MRVHRYTRSEILPVTETTNIGHDTLAREQPILASSGFPRCHPDRSDPIWIPEGDYSKTCKHGNTSVGPSALFHQASNGREDILFIYAKLAGLLKIVSECVQEQFGIGRRVDVPVCGGIHVLQ